MFAGIGKTDDNYTELVARCRKDLTFAKKVAKLDNLTSFKELATELKVKYPVLVKLKTIASNIVNSATQTEYICTTEVKKEEKQVKVVECGATKFYKQLLSSSDSIYSAESKAMLYGMAMTAMINIKGEELEPVMPNNSLPKELKHNPAPIAEIVGVLGKKHYTPEIIAEEIGNELLTIESNVPLTTAFYESAPPCVGFAPLIADIKASSVDESSRHEEDNEEEEEDNYDVNDNSDDSQDNDDNDEEEVETTSSAEVTLPLLKVLDNKNIQNRGIEESQKLYTSLYSSGFSKKITGDSFFGRHVYGIEFRKDMRKYVNFLTDFFVPDGVDTIHLFTKDVKYAIGLANMYPKLKIVMKGMQKNTSGVLWTMTGDDFRKSDKTNVVAVGIKARMYSYPSQADKYEYAQEQDGVEFARYKDYKYYFRYIIPHAMTDKKEYRLSVSTYDGHCIHTSYGDCYNRDIVWHRMALSLYHRHILPWHLTTMNNFVDWFPPLKKCYDFRIKRKEVQASILQGFITFVDSSEDDEYLQMLRIAAKPSMPRAVATKKIVEKKKTATNNVKVETKNNKKRTTNTSKGKFSSLM